ncbi:FUSC family protein [Streptomyces sp. NPDC059893]|uniref:FUSC family protein n=1 Tax=Streptomyces sp. NPDC059893 TaxID=3346990 RepID=UPI00365D3604
MSAVWGFFAPRYLPGTIRPNLVSAAISTATVVICCLLFTPQLGMISLLGALTPFWETGRPLWARVRNSLLVSAALTVSMSAGVLVAPHHWAIVPASVLVILVVGMLYYAFMLTKGPSPVMMFYAAVLGTFFGANSSTGWKMVSVTAFASVLTSLFLLLPLAFSPRGPERRAVAAARDAVAAYQEQVAAAEHDQRLARNAAYHAVNTAWLTLQSARPATRGRRHQAMTQELMQVNRSLAHTVLARLGMDPAVRPLTPDTPLPPGRPSWRFLLSHALRGGSVEWFATWRMGLAAGVAGLVSEAAGIGHPYWAILTATVVINQWMDRVTATRRAAHRTVGTLLGVGVVWAISTAHPSPWWTAILVIVCMVGQYLVLPMNYALALVFITPMALLAVEASGSGGTVAALTFDRFTDTVIGALTAFAVTWGTSWFFPRRLVQSQSARSLVSITTVEQANQAGDPFTAEGLCARAELQYELVHHLSILERAVADDPRLADLAPAEHLIADRGYAALGRAWESRPDRAVEKV